MQLLVNVALAVPDNSVKALGIGGLINGVESCLGEIIPAIVNGLAESTAFVSTLVTAILQALNTVLTTPLKNIETLLQQVLSLVTSLKS